MPPAGGAPSAVPHPIRGYLFIAVSALMWGASASLGKAAFRGLLTGETTTPLDAVILAQTRTTFSLLILVPLLLLVMGKSIFRIGRRDFLLCLVMGAVGLVGANFFYYYGIDKTSVATAITLQYTAPIWVLLYMVMRHFQHATPQRVGGVVLAFVGVVLSLGVLQFVVQAPFVRFVGLRWDTLGLLASMGAAFSFSFYNILGSRLIARNNNWNVFAYALLGSVLFWLIANPPTKIVAARYTHGQWLFMGFFAIVSMLVPFSFYLAGLRYLDATRAVVTACLEPVFAILIAATFLGDRPGWAQGVGMGLVLMATVLVQMPEKRVASG
jgi:drug/metabolite transporter (DMT)-like permease